MNDAIKDLKEAEVMIPLTSPIYLFINLYYLFMRQSLALYLCICF